MSTEHQRALNLAKQRRWRKRHPDKLREKQERARREKIQRVLDPRSGGYRTYELVDPRTGQLRVIGYCRETSVPWAGMWSLRNVSRARWATWLRELDSLNLEPGERFGWAAGSAWPISLVCAEMLVRFRIEQISGKIAPWWLLRLPMGFHYSRPPGFKPGLRERAVGRVKAGEVERFKSITAAQRITGVRDVYHKTQLLDTYKGWTWFDDGDGRESDSIV